MAQKKKYSISMLIEFDNYGQLMNAANLISKLSRAGIEKFKEDKAEFKYEYEFEINEKQEPDRTETINGVKSLIFKSKINNKE